jgi:hypothetical protein
MSGLFTLLKGDAELMSSTVLALMFRIAKAALNIINTVTFGMSENVKNSLAYVTDLYEGSKLAVLDAANDVTKGYNQIINGLDSVEDKTSKVSKVIRKLAQDIKDTPKELKIEIKAETDEVEIDQAIAETAARIESESKKRAANLQYEADIKLDQEAKDFIDFVSGSGKYEGKEVGIFTDQDLKYLETRLGNMRKELANSTDALKDTTETELKVPDDDKFKAQQAKLLKEIDANADIMEAKMKGFADIVESENSAISASFESIGESINATGDTLSELYNQLGSTSLDIFAQQSIQKRIRDEESRREEAFALQKELTLAQIDLIKQRASAMASGDPLITVSGDGLQPHLEAFMWEILSAIQVRANEDYGNFLLGIGA